MLAANPETALGAPSELHELRVRYLETLATLVGHTSEIQLYRGNRPDVVRADPRRLGLFIGDAKASESPGCRETRRRLAEYISSADVWLRAGYTANLAICHGAERNESWAALLNSLADWSGYSAQRLNVYRLDRDTSVTSVEVGGPAGRFSRAWRD